MHLISRLDLFGVYVVFPPRYLTCTFVLLILTELHHLSPESYDSVINSFEHGDRTHIAWQPF